MCFQDWEANSEGDEIIKELEIEEEEEVKERCERLKTANQDSMTYLDTLEDCRKYRDMGDTVEFRHGEYARLLGQAVQENTVVSRVVMDINVYRGEDNGSDDGFDNRRARKRQYRPHAQIFGEWSSIDQCRVARWTG
jgi:hypothetical protein